MVRASWLTIACGTLALVGALSVSSVRSAAQESKPAATAAAAGSAKPVEAAKGAEAAKPAAAGHDGHAGDGHAAGGHDAHGHGGHAAPFHPTKPIDPASPSRDLAIFTFITFCVTMLVLGKFAWNPIVAALDAREHRVAAHVQKAEKYEADAKASLAEYERRMSTVYDEVKAIIEEARKDGEALRKESLAKAEAEIQSVKDRVLLDLDRAKSAALKELAERGADIAVDLAGKLIGAQLNRGDHERLIGEALGKVRDKAGLN